MSSQDQLTGRKIKEGEGKKKEEEEQERGDKKALIQRFISRELLALSS